MDTDEPEVKAYIEKYAAVFNTMAQEILSRSNKGAQSPIDTEGLFNPSKLAGY
ncbi:MAG: polyhydroxyalkanoate synthase [Alphaproteobacteria bacterium]|jgi:polyhydroxyalkanoate synthase